MSTSPTIPDRWRRWFEYEVDSHGKTLGALAAASADARRHEGFQKAVDVMAHIAAARLIWLHRLGVRPVNPGGFFPKGVALEPISLLADGMHAEWRAYLSRLDDAEAARVFDYVATDGKPYRRRVEDILTQLFFHSGYHRGQIALLLRQIGAEPAVTDFVFWAEEPETR